MGGAGQAVQGLGSGFSDFFKKYIGGTPYYQHLPNLDSTQPPPKPPEDVQKTPQDPDQLLQKQLSAAQLGTAQLVVPKVNTP